jgi:predicted PurR-regulated permease PerM
LDAFVNERARLVRLAGFLAFAFAMLLAVSFIYARLLIPIFISGVLAYFLMPLVDKMEEKRINRTFSSLMIVLSIFGLFTAAVAKFVPQLILQGYTLSLLVPEMLRTWLLTLKPLLRNFMASLGILTEQDVDRLIASVDVVQQIRQQLENGIVGIWATSVTLFGGVINILIVPLLLFLFLQQFPIAARYLWELIPPDFRDEFHGLSLRLNSAFRSVLKGQAIVASSLGILYVVGLTIVDLESALAIGVIAGVCRLVPYLDVLVGGLLCAIVLVSDFHGWSQVFAVVGVFLVVQTIDGAVITPRVLSGQTGVHPILLLISIVAFADLFGFWGVVIAVPAMALFKTLWLFALPYYRQSNLFKTGS